VREAIAVIFGRRARRLRPRTAGYRISLPTSGGGSWVDPTGDVNGDGLGDLQITVYDDDSNRPPRTFVVFGKGNRRRQAITALGVGGFEIR
jgi:hypothetical protein